MISAGQWVKRTEYTLLLKIPFGINKCTYKCSVNSSPCTHMYAYSFCELLSLPFLSEGSEAIPCHKTQQWLSSKGALGLPAPSSLW